MSSHAIETAFPLTPLQQTVVLASVRDPEGSPYQVQCQVDLSGPLDPEVLAEAWRRLFRRHPSFRSFFAWEGREEPLQVVRADAPLPWTTLDWSGAEPEEQDRRWAELREQDASTPFDLTRAPVVRLTLVDLGGERHRLLWSVHHSLADGWSGLQVFREMLEEYEGLVQGAPVERPAPPSFGVFVSWLAARDRAAAQEYWVEQLAGLRDASPLPAARPGVPGPERDTVELELGRDLTQALADAATRLRVTPYSLLLGAWALVLDRHEPGQDSIAFATTVTERPADIPDVGAAVGMFLNTVPVRIPAPASGDVSGWLAAVQQTATQARHHGVGGLAEITRWAALDTEGTLARSLVVFESFPEAVQSRPQGGTLRLDDIRIAAPSDLPLTLMGHPGESMRLELAYDTALYTPEGARRILRLTARALGALSDPEAGPLDALDVLGPADRQLLTRWSRSLLPEPGAPDVLDAFDAAVAATPEATAVEDETASVTFRELDRDANRLAHRILAEGLGEDALVGIPAEPRVGSVVSILACLKAGVGYVPFDPAQPRARTDRILDAVERILVPAADSGRDDRWAGRPLVSAGLGEEPSTPPDIDRREDRIAYVIFTSGSTGRPKGVVVERGHLARSTAARLAWYDETPRRFLLLSSLAVDSSVAGLYWSLCSGGCLILAPSRAEQDAEELGRRIHRDSVTTTLMVPGLWRTLLEEVDGALLSSLECIVVAGEACPPSLVDEHHRRLPGVRLVNEYGPSEATVWATAGDLVPESDAAAVTIGRPVPFVRVYLLDTEGRPVPPGAAGEICLGGETVARGYLGPDPAGADRFVPDPFHPGGRMYRTGDRGRFREDGRLDFLGRVDDQVKIRGYRVEPGEIEGVLDTAPGVSEAAVVFDTLTPATQLDALVAALLERGGPDAESLLTRLLEPS